MSFSLAAQGASSRLARAVVSALGAAVIAAGCGASPDERAAADLTNGKALFVAGTEGNPSCGSCHVLGDAGTQGTIGPSLDDAFSASRANGFAESTVFEVVRRQIEIPRAGSAMPADLVTGKDAVDVAAYVARVAGTKGLEAQDAP